MLHSTLALLIAVIPAAGDSARTLLPGDGLPEGWARSGEARTFAGGALFEHINGGAELYHRNGFVELVVQSYARDADELELAIYDMATPEGAATIFVSNATGLETTSSYGVECTADEFQIAFHRGRFYVTLTAFSTGIRVEQAMALLARAVDGAILTR